MTATSVFADVDGIRTHYLDAGSGDGRPLLLLHGGAWGECAETTWFRTIDRLASRRRVIAPDWLGFGRTDKLRDFGDLAGRMLTHLGRLLQTLGVGDVDAVGLSMGGSHLLRDVTSEAPRIPLRRLVLVSAGGAPIQGAARQAMMDYDGTVESMRAQVRLAFADPAWADDDDYVTRRREFSLLPGAYEWFASLALRAPGAQPPPPGDPTPYERIDVPTLLVAGGADQLKPPGYADGPAQRIPRARLHVIPAAGHCPQLEAADEWTEVVATFLDEETPA